MHVKNGAVMYEIDRVTARSAGADSGEGAGVTAFPAEPVKIESPPI